MTVPNPVLDWIILLYIYVCVAYTWEIDENNWKINKHPGLLVIIKWKILDINRNHGKHVTHSDGLYMTCSWGNTWK